METARADVVMARSSIAYVASGTIRSTGETENVTNILTTSASARM